MSSNLALRNFSASMRLMKNVGASCAALPELAELKTLAELTARARLVRSALNARALFASFYQNLSGLGQALADFEQRKRLLNGVTSDPCDRCAAGDAVRESSNGRPALSLGI